MRVHNSATVRLRHSQQPESPSPRSEATPVNDASQLAAVDRVERRAPSGQSTTSASQPTPLTPPASQRRQKTQSSPEVQPREPTSREGRQALLDAFDRSGMSEVARNIFEIVAAAWVRGELDRHWTLDKIREFAEEYDPVHRGGRDPGRPSWQHAPAYLR